MEDLCRTAVIVDSYPLWLDALQPLLEGIGLSTVGRATNATEAVRLVREHRPDLVVTDYTLAAEASEGRVEGGVTLKLLVEARRANPSVKSIVLSDRDDAAERGRAFASHATAYCVRQALPDDLIAAIRQAFSPSIYLAHSLGTTGELVEPVPDGVSLTRREQEFLRLAADGSSNKQIAKMLWVTEQTVKFHLSNTYKKLGVSNRTEASRWAQQHGLLADANPGTPADAVRLVLVDDSAIAAAGAEGGPRVNSQNDTRAPSAKRIRVSKWRRVGEPFQLGPSPDEAEIEVGWEWRIQRKGDEPRLVRVEVVGGPFLLTDLPEGSRHAIRSRGATAVDAFLGQEEPPARIAVSTLGVRSRASLG